MNSFSGKQRRPKNTRLGPCNCARNNLAYRIYSVVKVTKKQGVELRHSTPDFTFYNL